MPRRLDLGTPVGPRGARRIPVGSGNRRVGRDPHWTEVLDVAEVWRIGEDWWRERPIRRTYFHLVVEDGRGVTIFRDELAATLAAPDANGGWFEQRY